MSTHSDLPEVRQGIARFAFSVLGGLLLALQLVLAPVAFAASTARLTTPAYIQQGVLDLAGVSVVRLVVEYTQPSTHTTVQCTGLGTLVGSWFPLTTTDKNNWVLTDGTLVNQRGQTCLSKIAGRLTRMTIYANTTYTNASATPVTLGQLHCSQDQAQKTSCSDAIAETLSLSLSGAVVFSFRTDSSHLQPFLSVAGQQGAGLLVGIELATAGSTPPPWPTTPVLPGTLSAPQDYLIPRLVPQTSNNRPGNSKPTSTPTSNALQLSPPNEPGMPIVNSAGNLVGMNLTGGTLLDGQTIQALLNQQAEFHPDVQALHKNDVNSLWVQGIGQFEAGNNYAAAQNTFKQLEGMNPQFQAPLAFEQQATAHLNNSQSSQTGGNPVTSSESTTFFGIPRSTFFIIGIVAGLLLLIVLFILVSMWARRRHELARFEAEQAGARHIDDKEVLQQQKTQQQNESIEMPKQVSLLQRADTSEQNVSTINSQSSHDILCPNCGHGVRAGATYCTNCRFQLTAIARGAPPTLNISSAPELSIVDKALASSTTSSQPEQASIKELVLDDLAIQATLKRLWEKTGRLTL